MNRREQQPPTNALLTSDRRRVRCARTGCGEILARFPKPPELTATDLFLAPMGLLISQYYERTRGVWRRVASPSNRATTALWPMVDLRREVQRNDRRARNMRALGRKPSRIDPPLPCLIVCGLCGLEQQIDETVGADRAALRDLLLDRRSLVADGLRPHVPVATWRIPRDSVNVVSGRRSADTTWASASTRAHELLLKLAGAFEREDGSTELRISISTERLLALEAKLVAGVSDSEAVSGATRL